MRKQADQVNAQRKKIDTERKLMETQIPAAKAMERIDKTKEGEYLRYLRRITESLLPFAPSGPRAIPSR